MIDMSHVWKCRIVTFLGFSATLCGAVSYVPSIARAQARQDIACMTNSACPTGYVCAEGVCSSINNVQTSPSAPAPASGGTQIPITKPEPKPSVQLQIAPGSPDCLKNGNCSLDDIVRTGGSFANLLTTISGALFLLAFVYGGAMYLLSFGDKGRVTTGKNAMKTASIGMLIVIFAWTIVNYVVSSITAGK